MAGTQERVVEIAVGDDGREVKGDGVSGRYRGYRWLKLVMKGGMWLDHPERNGKPF